MSTTIVCDECGRRIEPRSAGWTSRITRKFDHELREDFCSASCEALNLADELDPAGAARRKLNEAVARRRARDTSLAMRALDELTPPPADDVVAPVPVAKDWDEASDLQREYTPCDGGS